MRPVSIVNFGRCYLAATACGLVNALIRFVFLSPTTVIARQAGHLAPAVLFAGIVIGVAIPVLLWFFVARRASVVAKWIIVALFALSLWSMSRNGLSGVFRNVPGTLALLTLVLQAGAVFFLFRPDAAAWLSRNDRPHASGGDPR